MADLHLQDYQIKIKSGLAANIQATATLNSAVQGEPHYTTDTKAAYIFDGTVNAPIVGAAPYAAKTDNYTLTDADYCVDLTANSKTFTLLTAVGRSGKTFQLCNSGAGALTIATTSSQTIDGEASGAIVLTQYERLQVRSNNTNWIVE